MFIIIGIMFLGVCLGVLLRRVKFLRHIDKSVSFTILVLLFLIGSEVGGNEAITSNLGQLGFQAAVLAFLGVFGSVLAAWLVRRLFFKEENKS